MVEDNDCEEETDQDVCISTVAKAEEPMLSVGVHTKFSSDLATIPTEAPTHPKISWEPDDMVYGFTSSNKFSLSKFGMRRPRGFNRDWHKKLPMVKIFY